MDNFKAIYTILSVMEQEMDSKELDISKISAETLGVSEERWAKYIEMMEDVGYIKGVEIRSTVIGGTKVLMDHPRITLRGLEYLQENSIMQRIYKAAKTAKEVVPGL